MKEAVQEGRDRLVDMAESALREKLGAKEASLIIYTLKSAGKHRGWNERQEIDIRQQVEYDVTLTD